MPEGHSDSGQTVAKRVSSFRVNRGTRPILSRDRSRRRSNKGTQHSSSKYDQTFIRGLTVPPFKFILRLLRGLGSPAPHGMAFVVQLYERIVVPLRLCKESTFEPSHVSSGEDSSQPFTMPTYHPFLAPCTMLQASVPTYAKLSSSGVYWGHCAGIAALCSSESE
jgi:hypothetical protein